MATNLSEGEKQVIRILRKRGHTIMSIAAYTKRSRSAVKRVLREARNGI